MGAGAIEFLKRPLVAALLAILVLLIGGAILSPGFASPRQITNLLTIAALLGVVSAGQNLVILSGHEGIDLSVGGIISFSAFLAGNVMQQSDANLSLGLLLALGAAMKSDADLIAAGWAGVMSLPRVISLNSRDELQTEVAPARNILRGTHTHATEAETDRLRIHEKKQSIDQIADMMMWVAAAGVIMNGAIAFMLYRTHRDVNIRSALLHEIGDTISTAAVIIGACARRNSKPSGSRAPKFEPRRALVFGVSGFFSGLTGVLLLGYTGNVFIGAGDQYMLPSIIAVVIGGTSLAGGTGGYLGTMAGAVLLVLLQSILTTLSIPPFGRQVIYGATLLGLMLIHGRQRRLKG